MAGVTDMFRTMRSRRALLVSALGVMIACAAAIVLIVLRSAPRPPSIFDSPVDDVLSFFAAENFSELPLQERVNFMRDMLARFGDMEQSDSAVAAAFFAGLTGPAKEQLRDNVRVLARDVLVDAADRYFALDDPAARAKFLDDWLLSWARLAGEISGRNQDRSDQSLLEEMRRDARRDNERAIREPIAANPTNAWLFMDYWDSEVQSVASPVDQGKILHFLPALREHLLRGP